MTLLTAALELIAWLVLLLSGRPAPEPPADHWAITRSFDLLATLQCSVALGSDGEFSAGCSESPAAADDTPADDSSSQY